MKLNAVGLRGAHHLFPTELSGGMARRVALARAIALDPDLLIYDEPFAGLDPITLNVICNLIRTLNDALGGTSVVVTYDVPEAVKLADYLYVMGDGKIVAHGPTDEMIRSDDPFTRQFLHAQPDGPVPFHFPARPHRRGAGSRPGHAAPHPLMESLFPLGLLHYAFGGVLIGLGVSLLFVATGLVGGTSSFFSATLSWFSRAPGLREERLVASRAWRLVYAAGFVLGAFAFALVAPGALASRRCRPGNWCSAACSPASGRASRTGAPPATASAASPRCRCLRSSPCSRSSRRPSPRRTSWRS